MKRQHCRHVGKDMQHIVVDGRGVQQRGKVLSCAGNGEVVHPLAIDGSAFQQCDKALLPCADNGEANNILPVMATLYGKRQGITTSHGRW